MATVQEPTTVWHGDGDGEYNFTGVMTIADATGNILADATGNTIVDSGSTFSSVPATVWMASPGVQ